MTILADNTGRGMGVRREYGRFPRVGMTARLALMFMVPLVFRSTACTPTTRPAVFW
jgi:hypothetical protein